MTDQLESWYRRLIAVYPAGHRAVFAEDMIGVLMADARPEQTRPSVGTSYDVLKGAMGAWALRLRAGGRAWQRSEAPAAISMVALLVLVISSFGGIGMLLDETQNSSYGTWGEVGLWLDGLIWLPVAGAALLGFRRAAAWVAWGFGIVLPVIGSLVMTGGWILGYLTTVDSKLWFAVALIAAAGLSAERRQGTRFRDLSRGVTIPALIGVLILGGLVLLWGSETGSGQSWLGLPLLVIGVGLVAVACVRAVAGLGQVQARITAAAIALVLLLCGLYGWQDGAGTRYVDWMEQEHLALPLMLLISSLVVASSLITNRRLNPAVKPLSS
jgi:hypothetical protein